MSDSESEFRSVPAPIVAIAGWVVPGAGYWLIGERKRAVIIGVTILSLFFMGLLIAGVRVIEVPGFERRDGSAMRVKYRPNEGRDPNAPLLITSRGIVAEIVAKPWFVPQSLVGPVGLASGAVSVVLGQQGASTPTERVIAPLARIADIGTLYTAVAGMLNLLAMIDAAHRAGRDDENGAQPAGSAG